MKPQFPALIYGRGSATNKILLIIACLLVLAAGTHVFLQRNNPDGLPGIFGMKSSTPDLWSVFETYRTALTNGDLTTYNTVAYKDIPEKNLTQFKDISRQAYALISGFQEKDFTNRLQDSRQAIYSTDPVVERDAHAYNYNRTNIMFLRGTDGSWKLLVVDAPDRWSLPRTGTPENDALLESYTKSTVLDPDQDGLTDVREKCRTTPVGKTCIETDPKVRDSNGDGLWDGINAALM